MQKWTAVVLGLLVAGVLAVVVLKGGRQGGASAASLSDAGADASAEALADAGAALEDAGEATDPATPATATGVDAGGTLLLSGEVPPPLSADAPKSVTFGAILVVYRGAQQAPQTARTRDAALQMAKELAVEAKADFKAAVAKGDKGSTDNLGRIGRGILEPAPEYVLFSLPKGGVSDPVDTPKGFLILQRIE